MAFNLGFKGIDVPDGDGATPIMFPGLRNSILQEKQFLYAAWLIKKGARLDCCLNSLGVSAAHNLAKSITRVLTMGALGIRHLPRCHECSVYPEEKVQKVKQEEEWDEILDEVRYPGPGNWCMKMTWSN